jgi:phage I-like protein
MLRAAFSLHTLSDPGDGPVWLKVLGVGRNEPRDGRPPLEAGDVQNLERIVERTRARLRETEMMVDYDHQALNTERTGGRAPAAGWVKAIEARPDGIWARVQWTAAARAAIRAGEYRYLSPAVTHDDDFRVRAIVNLALVNMPAFDLVALAAKATMETAMKFSQKLAAALGLPEAAGEDDILAALPKAATAAAAAALKPVAEALGCEADGEKILAAAVQLKGAGDGAAVAALKAELATTAGRLAALTNSIAAEKAAAFVDAAIRQGRVGVKPLRDHYIARHAASPAGQAEVEKEIAALPTLAGELPVPAGGAGGDGALTAEQKAVCRALGMKEEAYAAQLKNERTAA